MHILLQGNVVILQPHSCMVGFFDKIPCDPSDEQGNDSGDQEDPYIVTTSVDLLDIHSIHRRHRVYWDVQERQDCDYGRRVSFL